MKIEHSAGEYRQGTTKTGDGKLEFSGKMYDKSRWHLEGWGFVVIEWRSRV